ncbi:hypothetical protein [Streptomyces sp. cg35]|uniref:hypothetical protein n=1 Tax=Streptomyces sp. cg35 TaxID=3421650 RepID=UPI003D175066
MAWESKLRSCGLEMTATPPIPDAIPPAKAILAVAGGRVRPEVAAEKSARGLRILDEHWKVLHAKLASHTGEFLIILWGPGSMEAGWFQVTERNDPLGLPSRVASVIGRPEFCCLSLDNKTLYAVTVEEDEYWIVTHQFS